jgi:low affinity Fe/Cu permease
VQVTNPTSDTRSCSVFYEGTLKKVILMPEQRKRSDLFCRIRDAFHVFARTSSSVLGSAWSFIVALLIILVWGVTGPMFHFSDTWQLIINTGTTIVTFLMVFLIQNTQNRDAKAVHLKLDELIRALQGARNHLVDLEKLSDDELEKLELEFEKIHQRAKRSEEALVRHKDTAAAR